MDKDKCITIVKAFNDLEDTEKLYVIKQFRDYYKNAYEYKFSDLIEKICRCKPKLKEWKSLSGSDQLDNRNYGIDDDVIESLFCKYESNDEFKTVLSRVVLINQLYGTRLSLSCSHQMPSIYEVTNRIIEVMKDKHVKKEKNSDDVKNLVKKISDMSGYDTADIKKWRIESFASKYLSFVFLSKGIDAVPITDTYARKTLGLIALVNGESRKSIDKYDGYYDLINNTFSGIYGEGESICYKEVDAFLWLMGKALSVEFSNGGI